MANSMGKLVPGRLDSLTSTTRQRAIQRGVVAAEIRKLFASIVSHMRVLSQFSFSLPSELFGIFFGLTDVCYM